MFFLTPKYLKKGRLYTKEAEKRLAYHRDRLTCEGFAELDQVKVVDVEPGALQSLASGRDRAQAHDRRVDTRDRGRDDPRQGLQALSLGEFPGHNHCRGRPVVDA